MENNYKQPDPLTIDLSKSLGYQLYCSPRIWNDSSAQYPYGERFYALHLRSLRCQMYTFFRLKI